jgi:hypothetical protein
MIYMNEKLNERLERILGKCKQNNITKDEEVKGIIISNFQDYELLDLLYERIKGV